jgi:flagellar biosynthesis/type III secretory pathway protein FliH
MRESSTIQAFIEEGRQKGLKEGLKEGLQEGKAREARRIILRLGRKRFGAVNEAVEAKINDIVDLERLEELTERLGEVSGWDELLDQG